MTCTMCYTFVVWMSVTSPLLLDACPRACCLSSLFDVLWFYLPLVDALSWIINIIFLHFHDLHDLPRLPRQHVPFSLLRDLVSYHAPASVPLSSKCILPAFPPSSTCCACRRAYACYLIHAYKYARLAVTSRPTMRSGAATTGTMH